MRNAGANAAQHVRARLTLHMWCGPADKPNTQSDLDMGSMDFNSVMTCKAARLARVLDGPRRAYADPAWSPSSPRQQAAWGPEAGFDTDMGMDFLTETGMKRPRATCLGLT
jgi:hypothetical protein